MQMLNKLMTREEFLALGEKMEQEKKKKLKKELYLFKNKGVLDAIKKKVSRKLLVSITLALLWNAQLDPET